MKAPERIKRSAGLLGPAVAQFAERLFDDRHPWSKIRQGHKLVRLGERYTGERLDAACQRALDVVILLPHSTFRLGPLRHALHQVEFALADDRRKAVGRAHPSDRVPHILCRRRAGAAIDLVAQDASHVP